MDIVEIYIPSISIITLFVAFFMQIFSRYVLNSPMVWPYEVAQISYVIAIMLGTCYAERNKENISFSIVYDAVPPTVQKIFDLISHVMIVGVLGFSLYSLIPFYEFFMTRFSVVLKVPLGIVYFPYVPFVVITICRYLKRLVHIVRTPAAQLAAENAHQESEEAENEQ